MTNKTKLKMNSREKNISLTGTLWRPNPDVTVTEKLAEWAARCCVVIVHQWSVLGGAAVLTHGLASSLVERFGATCVTFNLRGVAGSKGHPSYCGDPEVEDVLGVCDWVTNEVRRPIILVGISAGGPIAGSAASRCPEVKAFIANGYPFGSFAWWVFGSHFGAILGWSEPKLFLQGSEDGFCSPGTLKSKCKHASGVAKYVIVPKVGHFELESADYDQFMGDQIDQFLSWELRRSFE